MVDLCWSYGLLSDRPNRRGSLALAPRSHRQDRPTRRRFPWTPRDFSWTFHEGPRISELQLGQNIPNHPKLSKIYGIQVRTCDPFFWSRFHSESPLGTRLLAYPDLTEPESAWLSLGFDRHWVGCQFKCGQVKHDLFGIPTWLVVLSKLKAG